MPLNQFPSPSAITALGLAGGQGFLGFDLDDSQYQAAFRLNSITRGYRLADLWGYESNSQARFGAIWEECREHPEQFTQHAIALTDFQAVFDQRKADGFRPTRICGYNVGAATQYAAIWEKAAGPPWAARHNFNILNLAPHIRKVRQDGFRIADLNGYTIFEPSPDMPGSTVPTWVQHFSSIWVQSDGRDWDVTLPVGIDGWQAVFERMTGQGWWPVQVSAFGSTPRVIARWEKRGALVAFARHRLDAAAYGSELSAQDAAGLRPASVGGYAEGHGPTALSRFCPLWSRRDADQVVPRLVTDFLRNYDVPGISLAVARHGRLAYAFPAGLANTSTGEAVQVASRFRIASLAKPITAAAVTQLVAAGRLRLDDTVFASGGLLSTLGPPLDQRVTQVTVLHLLQHAAGGWANDANDPMFTQPTLNARALIKAVLAARRLDTAPGTAFAYSNFGYCVLGRVIEAVTGVTYETYVRDNILTPCGIAHMEIAGNTLADRKRDEVVYQGLDGENPYAMQVTRMDAHGGWLAPAVELLRFAVRVDGLPSVPDLLPAAAISTMTTPSVLVGSNHYAAGWHTTPEGTWWHDGSLPGTRSLLVRTADGYCWAAVVNSGRTDTNDRTRDTFAGLDALMWAIRDKVDFWPFNSPL